MGWDTCSLLCITLLGATLWAWFAWRLLDLLLHTIPSKQIARVAFGLSCVALAWVYVIALHAWLEHTYPIRTDVVDAVRGE